MLRVFVALLVAPAAGAIAGGLAMSWVRPKTAAPGPEVAGHAFLGGFVALLALVAIGLPIYRALRDRRDSFVALWLLVCVVVTVALLFGLQAAIHYFATSWSRPLWPTLAEAAYAGVAGLVTGLVFKRIADVGE